MEDLFRDTEVKELNYGLTTFDNVLEAFLTIFQTITLEGWTKIMEIYSDAYLSPVVTLYFIACVVVCSIFILNLTIAIMLNNY